MKTLVTTYSFRTFFSASPEIIGVKVKVFFLLLVSHLRLSQWMKVEGICTSLLALLAGNLINTSLCNIRHCRFCFLVRVSDRLAQSQMALFLKRDRTILQLYISLLERWAMASFSQIRFPYSSVALRFFPDRHLSDHRYPELPLIPTIA